MNQSESSNNQLVVPFRYSGSLVAPASKSYLQRAIAIASLSVQACKIQNFYPSKDAEAALSIAASLGAQIQRFEHAVLIQKGKVSHDSVVLNCGESGLSTRMFSPIAALFIRKTIIAGEGSLLKRPINMIEDALNQLGVLTNSNAGFLPLEFHGPLKPGEILIDGSESSQLLTGLLIALPLLNEPSVVRVKNLKSIPYIQMTLDILAHFGIAIDHYNFETFSIPGSQKPNAQEYYIEGDWSGAAFHLVGAAVSGSIRITGLNRHSSQADSAILDALHLCGADVHVSDNEIHVAKNQCKAFSFDATHCPDLFPPLAVLAACCEGQSEIRGVSRLKHKESNRALTIQEEFAKLNISVQLDGDFMRIEKAEVRGATIDSRNDHRIAMAGAILASVSNSAICIENAQAVNKSYPSFFEDLEQVRRF